MSDRVKHYLEIGAAIVALAIIAWIVVSAIQQHDDRVKMEATIAAQETLIKKLDQESKAAGTKADAERKSLDQQLKATKGDMAKQLDLLNKLAGFEEPITVNAPAPAVPGAPPSAGETQTGKLPNAPSATLSAVQVAALVEQQVDFGKCKVDRGQLQGDLARCGEKLVHKQNELDSAVNAVKGGSVWDRFKRNRKAFTWGAAIGGTAAAVLIKKSN